MSKEAMQEKLKEALRHIGIGANSHICCPKTVKNNIDQVLELLEQPEEVRCKWNMGGEGHYDSECNNSFGFLGCSSPEENGFVYCPYCGRKIRVQE